MEQLLENTTSGITIYLKEKQPEAIEEMGREVIGGVDTELLIVSPLAFSRD